VFDEVKIILLNVGFIRKTLMMFNSPYILGSKFSFRSSSITPANVSTIIPQSKPCINKKIILLEGAIRDIKENKAYVGLIIP